MTKEFEGYFADLSRFSSGWQLRPQDFMTAEYQSAFRALRDSERREREMNQFAEEIVSPVLGAFSSAVGGFLEPGRRLDLPTLINLPYEHRLGRLSWLLPNWTSEPLAETARTRDVAQLNIFNVLGELYKPSIRLAGFSERFETRFRGLVWRVDHFANADTVGSWTIKALTEWAMPVYKDDGYKVTLVGELSNPSSKEVAQMLRFLYTELG